jgi:prolyl-tRNA editing enzyme YbaK/EbsC (Cys-tRNA(Pro) deacylase)
MKEKVLTTARELGLEVDVRRLDGSTRTATDAAEAVGCDLAQIAKSIVFVVDGDPIVCIASGAHRIDVDKLCLVTDSAEARPASPDEVRAATGFPVGGVPPFGHGLPVVMDEALLAQDRVWAAAGDGNSLFEVDPRQLVGCTRARVADVASG